MAKKAKSSTPRTPRLTNSWLQTSIMNDIKLFEAATKCRVTKLSLSSGSGQVKIDTVPLPE